MRNSLRRTRAAPQLFRIGRRAASAIGAGGIFCREVPAQCFNPVTVAVAASIIMVTVEPISMSKDS
jgi:hypothetical protein